MLAVSKPVDAIHVSLVLILMLAGCIDLPDNRTQFCSDISLCLQHHLADVAKSRWGFGSGISFDVLIVVE